MKRTDLRLALYARVSTEAQEEDGQSLTTQIEMMREAARRLGATVAAVYQVQESAMPGRERPSLTRMLRDAAAGSFDAVMVCKLDRLSRSVEVLTHVENSLRTFGIQLFEGRDEHNLRSAEGRLNRGMQALIGEYSVNRLKWSACASRLDRARRGWPHSGTVPFGREVSKVRDRKNLDAVWTLDPAKAEVAAEMYRLYIGKGLNLAQVGKQVCMQPETVRRILMNQGGPEWVRTFLDPATGERVEVTTAIPPLFTAQQIARLHERAKQNQVERANWPGRTREYPLSGYLRCSNPVCGWSNLSGHQSTESRPKYLVPGKTPSQRSYYLHVSRNRKGCGCVIGIPAEHLEDEIFSRLGQLLADSDQLVSAVRAALVTDAADVQRLKSELDELLATEKSANRVLANALEVVYEQKGTAAAELAQVKVDDQNMLLAGVAERLAEVRNSLRVVQIPKDFAQRFSDTLQVMVGLHGHAPMRWPHKSKKALLSLFFGGSKSTRFDRDGKNKRSDSRGIFVAKVVTADGTEYFAYEARGSIVDFSGALARVAEIYEAETVQGVARKFNPEELAELANLAAGLEGALRFRSSTDASRRWSA